MFLNEYRSQIEERSIQKKQGVLNLETHDALRTSNKILSIQLEAIAKKLEAQEVENISSNGEV